MKNERMEIIGNDTFSVQEQIEILEEEWDFAQEPSYVKNAILVAINAMRLQIPKKPIGRHTDYKCPVCGRRVRSGKGSSSRVRDNFCQRCGQALDWGGAE